MKKLYREDKKNFLYWHWPKEKKCKKKKEMKEKRIKSSPHMCAVLSRHSNRFIDKWTRKKFKCIATSFFFFFLVKCRVMSGYYVSTVNVFNQLPFWTHCHSGSKKRRYFSEIWRSFFLLIVCFLYSDSFLFTLQSSSKRKRMKRVSKSNYFSYWLVYIEFYYKFLCRCYMKLSSILLPFPWQLVNFQYLK